MDNIQQQTKDLVAKCTTTRAKTLRVKMKQLTQDSKKNFLTRN